MATSDHPRPIDDLDALLASMAPEVRPGEFVVASVDEVPSGVEVLATVVEDEGLSIVVPRGDADALGLAYDYVAAWITLTVHSSLHAVGLTAVVATALAERGISCNVIAGFHHDHLLVPHDRRDDALGALERLRPRPGA